MQTCHCILRLEVCVCVWRGGVSWTAARHCSLQARHGLTVFIISAWLASLTALWRRQSDVPRWKVGVGRGAVIAGQRAVAVDTHLTVENSALWSEEFELQVKVTFWIPSRFARQFYRSFLRSSLLFAMRAATVVLFSVVSVRLSVCLSVCQHDNSWTVSDIITTFSGHHPMV